MKCLITNQQNISFVDMHFQKDSVEYYSPSELVFVETSEMYLYLEPFQTVSQKSFITDVSRDSKYACETFLSGIVRIQF